jgi:hypothetical protein
MNGPRPAAMLYAANHKDIGSLYLWFSLVMRRAGGLFLLQLPTAKAVTSKIGALEVQGE